MRLRMLKVEDAPFMLEWMHDKFVTRDMQTDFENKTILDCNNFIINAQDTKKNMHLAIVNNDDQYMGTVSLKNISQSSAEFAITIRAIAMGKGYSSYAMKEIIKIGFNDLKIKKIYWCVSPVNKRAVRFYDKSGYQKKCIEDNCPMEGYSFAQTKEYIWYEITR